MLFDSSNFKVVDSSMNQLHPASLYRLSSMIGGIVTSRANRMISDGIGEYFDSISSTDMMELNSMLEDFSLLDKSYLVNWRPITLESMTSLWKSLYLLTGSHQEFPVSKESIHHLLEDLHFPGPKNISEGMDSLIQESTLLSVEGMYILDTMHLSYVSCVDMLLLWMRLSVFQD